MTNDNNNTFSCSLSDDLVSYLYDEMPTAEKGEFELHLLDCGACTAEFAGLSVARLGVYEYHRDEFASLVTPRIEIPYVKAFEQVSEPLPTTRSSWRYIFQGLFAATPKWAAAGGAFALVAVSLAGAFFVSNFRGGNNDLAQTNSKNSQSVNVNRAINSPSIQKEVSVPPANPLRPDNAKASVTTLPSSDRRVVKVSKPAGKTPKPLDRKSDVRTATSIQKTPNPSRQNAPRLNNFEDEDDNTLRLADLFADVDTRR